MASLALKEQKIIKMKTRQDAGSLFTISRVPINHGSLKVVFLGIQFYQFEWDILRNGVFLHGIVFISLRYYYIHGTE